MTHRTPAHLEAAMALIASHQAQGMTFRRAVELTAASTQIDGEKLIDEWVADTRNTMGETYADWEDNGGGL